LHALEAVVRERAPFFAVEQAEQAFLESVGRANREITEHARTHPEKRGMGTTMTAAALFGPEVVIVQVGDSRAYLRRGDRLQQLTMDQNVVGQMIASGRITPEAARHVKQRNMLLEAIGVQPKVGPDLIRVRVQPGDDLMVCTDGLTGPLDDPQLLDIMVRNEDPLLCCRALTEAACAAGGPDNITVCLARFGPSAHGEVPDLAAAFEVERRPAVAP
jgi:protein phosphatase